MPEILINMFAWIDGFSERTGLGDTGLFILVTSVIIGLIAWIFMAGGES